MRVFGSSRIQIDLDRYLRSLEDIKDKVVVDIPAGGGATSTLLRCLGARVEPYDLFPEFFEVEGLECRRADMTKKLPIEDGRADMVICQEGIEHVSDQLFTLREFNRILRRGGRLIVTTPSMSNLRAKFSNFCLEAPVGNRLPPSEVDAIWFAGDDDSEAYFGHVFLTGIQRLRVLARLAGLRIVRIHPVRISWSCVLLGGFFPLLLLVNLHAYFRSCRRYQQADPAWKKAVFHEILRVNLNPNVLFGKHLFVEFEKESELREVGRNFFKKLDGARNRRASG